MSLFDTDDTYSELENMYDNDPTEETFISNCASYLVDSADYDYEDAKDECEIYYSSKKDRLAKGYRTLTTGYSDSDMETTLSAGLLGLVGDIRRP